MRVKGMISLAMVLVAGAMFTSAASGDVVMPGGGGVNQVMASTATTATGGNTQPAHSSSALSKVRLRFVGRDGQRSRTATTSLRAGASTSSAAAATPATALEPAVAARELGADDDDDDPSYASDGDGDWLEITGTRMVTATKVSDDYYTSDCFFEVDSAISPGTTPPVTFCGEISAYDADTGDEIPATNSLTTTIYDACGNVIQVDTAYWGPFYDSYQAPGGVLDSQFYFAGGYVPCWGTWTTTQTASVTFTDGQTLTVSDATSFTVTAVATDSAASETGNGVGPGSGGASRYNQTTHCVDPVDCASGDLSESFTDAAVPGRGPGLDLTRTYNSLQAGTEGMFGHGWSSTYDSNLVVNDDGSVTITEGDGSQVTATPDGDGFDVPAWADSTLTHNEDGTWTFIRQATMTYTYSSSGQLTAITDRNGYSTDLSYNGSGQLASVTDPEGRSLTFSYGTNGLVSSVSDPAEQSTTYGYDDSGNLTSVTDSADREWQFGYDSSHLMTSMTDPDSGTTTNVFDSDGRVTQQTDPAGLETTFSYSGDNYSDTGGMTTITGPHGETTDEYYADGVLEEVAKDPTGQNSTWFYEYDPNTLAPTMVTDPNGDTTTMTYDSSGNMLSMTDADGNTTTYTYNSLNEPLTQTDPLGIETAWSYDSNGNPESEAVTGAGGSPTLTTSYSYTDGNPGDLTEVTDPRGNVTDYTYDTDGDLASVSTHPSSGVTDTTDYAYDDLGRMVCAVAPDEVADSVSCAAAGDPRAAHTATWAYDPENEVTAATDPRGNTTDYDYNQDGDLLTVTAPGGEITKTTFDADNRPLTATQGYGTSSASTVSYAYDIAPGTGDCSSSVTAAAYCTTTTDPTDQATVTYLNDQDLPIQVTSPESGTSTISYDPTGEPTNWVTSGGDATAEYDGDGQLSSVQYSDPATGFTAPAEVDYYRDADGNVSEMDDGTGTTSYGYDSLGRLTSVTDGAGATVAYGYNDDGQITTISYPGSAGTVTQGYDNAGQETSVADWLGNTTDFGYDADGNITSEQYPDSTTATMAFNDDDEITSIADASNSTPSTPFASMAYSYDTDDQVQSETDTGLPQPASTGTTSFAYNTAGDPTTLGADTQTFNSTHQITDQTDGTNDTTFAYDTLGDRTSITTSAGTVAATYDQLGELTSYGNADYTYDGNGLLASKTVGSGDPQQFTWGETTGSGAPELLQHSSTNFIYGPDGTPLEQIDGSTPTYYLHDQLGSTRVLTNQAGTTTGTFTYSPYGNVAASNGTATTAFGYTGAYTDPTSGLVYLEHRYYDPSTGQFISNDPLQTLTQQPYSYTNGNPTNGIDPSGLMCSLSGCLSDIGNGLAGFGAGLTGGLSTDLLNDIGISPNVCSTAYQDADTAGGATGLAAMAFFFPEGDLLEAATEAGGDLAAEDGGALPLDGSSMSTDEALTQGGAYLGDGYTEPEPGSGRYVSADGTRVFRMGESDITGAHGGGPHV